MCFGQGQGFAELARAVQKVFALVRGQLVGGSPIAVLGHLSDACPRRTAAQQDCAGRPLRLSDEVEAVIHAVDEIDVGRPRRGKQRFGPGGAAVIVGVAGLINGTDVSLRLVDADDQGDAVLDPDKIFSQKVLGDLAGVPVIK